MIFLNNLGPKTKLTLAIGAAVALASIPSTVAIILSNTGGLTYSKGDTEINFSGKTKQAANEAEYSTKELANKLIDLQGQIAVLKLAAEKRPELIPEKIKNVDSSFERLLPTASQVFQDTEKLTEYVEEAISE